MYRFALMLLTAFALWGCIGEETYSPEESTLVEVGELAPDFEVELFDGGTLRLSDLRGKVVLLTFFSSWCPECREELSQFPSTVLNRFPDSGFASLCISRGETREAVAEFRASSGLCFPMALDPSASVYFLYAREGVPRNFLLDHDGRIVSMMIGYNASSWDAMLDLAAELIFM